jgi:WD40 repeat protein
LTSLCLNELSHEIAVGDEAGEIKIFSNLDGKLVYLDQISHGAPVTSLAYSPDGDRLVSGDDLGRILIWKINK